MVPVAIILLWCLSLGGATVAEDDHHRRVLRTLYREFSSFAPPGNDLAVLYLEPPTNIVGDNKIRLVSPYLNILYGMFYQLLKTDFNSYSWVVWPDNKPKMVKTFNSTNRPNFAVAREDWSSSIVTSRDKRIYKNAYRHPEFLFLRYYLDDMMDTYTQIFLEKPKFIYLLTYNFPAHSSANQIQSVAEELSAVRKDFYLILGYYRIRASEGWNGLDLTGNYNIKLINLDKPTETPGGDIRCINTGTSMITQNTVVEHSNDHEYQAGLKERSGERWYHRDFSLVPKLATDCDFHNILALKLSSTKGDIDIVWYDNDFFQENDRCTDSDCESWIGLYESAEKQDNDYLMMDRVHAENYGVIHTDAMAVDGMEVRLFHTTAETNLTVQKSFPWQSDCGYDPVALSSEPQVTDDTESQVMMQLKVNSGQVITYIWIGEITPDCCTKSGTYSSMSEDLCLWGVDEIFLQSSRAAAKGKLKSHFRSKLWSSSEMDCETYNSSEMDWATCQCTYSTDLPSGYYKVRSSFGFRLVARVEGTTPTFTTNASPEWIPGIC